MAMVMKEKADARPAHILIRVRTIIPVSGSNGRHAGLSAPADERWTRRPAWIWPNGLSLRSIR